MCRYRLASSLRATDATARVCRNGADSDRFNARGGSAAPTEHGTYRAVRALPVLPEGTVTMCLVGCSTYVIHQTNRIATVDLALLASPNGHIASMNVVPAPFHSSGS